MEEPEAGEGFGRPWLVFWPVVPLSATHCGSESWYEGRYETADGGDELSLIDHEGSQILDSMTDCETKSRHMQGQSMI